MFPTFSPVRLILPAAALAALFAVGCEQTSEPAPTAEVQTVAVESETTAPATQPTEAASAELVPYPLDRCLVSGEKLGSMGEPYVMAYQGREIKFCCEGCVDMFKEEPATYLAQLDAAPAASTGDEQAHEHHDHDGHAH